MISTFSSTIRRREMDAVLTCLVDEKIGPGEMNAKLCQSVKEFFNAAGSVAFRSPEIALSYALKALGLEKSTKIMVSALAPSWHYSAVKSLGFSPIVLDVDDSTGLVNSEIIQGGIQKGGSVLLFHESMGILPDSDEMKKILELGTFVVEDVSQSIGSGFEKLSDENVSSSENHLEKTLNDNNQDALSESSENSESKTEVTKDIKKAGTFGVFSILGLEENDSVTGGGGAVLIAPNRREWIVLKKICESLSKTERLPDINSALAFVQLKEFSRNEEARKTIFNFYRKSFSSASKNRIFVRGNDCEYAVWSFPVVLSGSFADASAYAKRKEIEIVHAYSDSVIAKILDEESSELENGELKGDSLELLSNSLIHAKSLFLRTVLFPLYPRMNSETVTKITKILATLP